MAILILKVLTAWSAIALIAGFGLGAAIRHSDRIRKDAFLSCVFSYLEDMHSTRS